MTIDQNLLTEGAGEHVTGVGCGNVDTLHRMAHCTLTWVQAETTMIGILPAHQKTIDDFFAAMTPLEPAFRYVGLSYLAVRFDKEFILLHG